MAKGLKMDTERAILALKASEMFRLASQETLERLASASGFLELPAGEMLYWEGDDPGPMHILVSGQLSIERINDLDRAVSITLRHPPDVVGELSVLEGVPRTADARATETTVLLEVPAQAILDAIEADHGLARGVISLLSRKLRESISHKIKLQWKVPRRLASALLDSARHGHERIEGQGVLLLEKLTQDELAVRINCTREHVNRAMKQFRDEGLVSVKGGRYLVTSVRRLRLIAETEDRA
jgi:CRP-like cAMP-binding protein